jgi:hypothetical protein
MTCGSKARLPRGKKYTPGLLIQNLLYSAPDIGWKTDFFPTPWIESPRGVSYACISESTPAILLPHSGIEFESQHRTNVTKEQDN